MMSAMPWAGIIVVVLWVVLPVAAVAEAYRTFFRNRDSRTTAAHAGVAFLGVAILVYMAIFPAGYLRQMELLLVIGISGIGIGLVSLVIGFATEREMRRKIIGAALILIVWIPLTAFVALPGS